MTGLLASRLLLTRGCLVQLCDWFNFLIARLATELLSLLLDTVNVFSSVVTFFNDRNWSTHFTNRHLTAMLNLQLLLLVLLLLEVCGELLVAELLSREELLTLVFDRDKVLTLSKIVALSQEER